MCFNQTKWKWNKYFTQSILKYTKPEALPLSNRDCIFWVQMMIILVDTVVTRGIKFSRCNGYWILDTGYWILNTGYWILDTGYWILNTGYWIQDTGY